jgi:hypothetical protein
MTPLPAARGRQLGSREARLKGLAAVAIGMLLVSAACGLGPPQISGNASATPSDSAPGVSLAPIDSSTPIDNSAPVDLSSAPTVSFSGKTSKKTTVFTIGAPIRVDYTFNGSGNFVVQLTATDGSLIGSVADRVGKGSATTWLYGGTGKGYFDVTADGPWTLKATTMLPPISAVPVTFTGSSDLVTMPFAAKGALTVSWTNSGAGNFIVELAYATDGNFADSVANLIGKSTGSAQLINHQGPFALEVNANGPWTLTVTARP